MVLCLCFFMFFCFMLFDVMFLIVWYIKLLYYWEYLFVVGVIVGVEFG